MLIFGAPGKSPFQYKVEKYRKDPIKLLNKRFIDEQYCYLAAVSDKIVGIKEHELFFQLLFYNIDVYSSNHLSSKDINPDDISYSQESLKNLLRCFRNYIYHITMMYLKDDEKIFKTIEKQYDKINEISLFFERNIQSINKSTYPVEKFFPQAILKIAADEIPNDTYFKIKKFITNIEKWEQRDSQKTIYVNSEFISFFANILESVPNDFIINREFMPLLYTDIINFSATDTDMQIKLSSLIKKMLYTELHSVQEFINSNQKCYEEIDGSLYRIFRTLDRLEKRFYVWEFQQKLRDILLRLVSPKNTFESLVNTLSQSEILSYIFGLKQAEDIENIEIILDLEVFSLRFEQYDLYRVLQSIYIYNQDHKYYSQRLEDYKYIYEEYGKTGACIDFFWDIKCKNIHRIRNNLQGMFVYAIEKGYYNAENTSVLNWSLFEEHYKMLYPERRKRNDIKIVSVGDVYKYNDHVYEGLHDLIIEYICRTLSYGQKRDISEMLDTLNNTSYYNIHNGLGAKSIKNVDKALYVLQKLNGYNDEINCFHVIREYISNAYTYREAGQEIFKNIQSYNLKLFFYQIQQIEMLGKLALLETKKEEGKVITIKRNLSFYRDVLALILNYHLRNYDDLYIHPGVMAQFTVNYSNDEFTGLLSGLLNQYNIKKLISDYRAYEIQESVKQRLFRLYCIKLIPISKSYISEEENIIYTQQIEDLYNKEMHVHDLINFPENNNTEGGVIMSRRRGDNIINSIGIMNIMAAFHNWILEIAVATLNPSRLYVSFITQSIDALKEVIYNPDKVFDRACLLQIYDHPEYKNILRNQEDPEAKITELDM